MKQTSILLFCLLIMTQQNSLAQEGQLKACPSSPNCVSSQSTDSHFIEPFLLTSPAESAWQKVISTLSNMERIKIVHSDDKKLHAEETSLIFRFVDDIHLILNEDEKRIDIRSASRVGHSDFGVNRKRIETLRVRLQKAKLIQ